MTTPAEEHARAAALHQALWDVWTMSQRLCADSQRLCTESRAIGAEVRALPREQAPTVHDPPPPDDPWAMDGLPGHALTRAIMAQVLAGYHWESLPPPRRAPSHPRRA
jgi:hypothetical protein